MKLTKLTNCQSSGFDAAGFVETLKSRGVVLTVLPNGRIRSEAPPDAFLPELRQAAVDNRDAIIRFLANGDADPGLADDDPPALICPRCDSSRIGQGRQWRWCMDCETRIGPAGDRRDLPEIDGARVIEPPGQTVTDSDADQGGDSSSSQQHLATRRPDPRAPVPIDWPVAAADFCLLLAPGDIPLAPFNLNDWTVVEDAERFLRSLQADIRRGPSGPRAFYGSLQSELIGLQQLALRWAERK